MPLAADVVAALIPALAADLAGVEAMARLASDEATSDDNRAENKYDTRSLEASYLARGQAERVISLRRALSWLQAFEARSGVERVGLGTVVEARIDALARVFFLVPDEGGRVVDVGGVPVQVITPTSPMARAMLGLEAGDCAEVELGREEVEIEIEAIHG